MATLRKSQTPTKVTYTGMSEAAGMVLVIDRDAAKLSIHQTIVPALVGGKTWQQLVAEIDAANTLV